MTFSKRACTNPIFELLLYSKEQEMEPREKNLLKISQWLLGSWISVRSMYSVFRLINFYINIRSPVMYDSETSMGENGLTRRTKWKPHKDSTHSFRTKEQNVYCARRKVIGGETSTRSGKFDYRRGHTVLESLFTRVEYVTHRYPTARQFSLKCHPAWTSRPMSQVRRIENELYPLWIFPAWFPFRVGPDFVAESG